MNKGKIFPVGLTVLSLTAVFTTAVAENYPKEMETNLISVCQHAAENDRLNLHRSVQKFTSGSKLTGPTYRMLSDGLRCNGMSLATFASYYGAEDTLRVLERYSVPTRIEIRDIEVSRLPPENIQVSFVAAR